MIEPDRTEKNESNRTYVYMQGYFIPGSVQIGNYAVTDNEIAQLPAFLLWPAII